MRASVRILVSSLSLASSLSLTGCTPVTSLNPVLPAGEEEAVAGLEGYWLDPDGETGLSIRAGDGPGTYELILWENDVPSSDTPAFEMRVARIGADHYGDVVSKGGQVDSGLALRVHLPVRVRLEGDALELALLDQKGLGQALDELTLSHAVVENDIVLTGPTAELSAFLQEHGGRDDLFDARGVFHRHGAPR